MLKNLRKIVPLVAAAGLVLAGCSTSGGENTAGDEKKLSVNASFYPLEYLSERIGGKHVKVTSLTPANTEPHDLELSPKVVTELGKADVVVYLEGFQPSVDTAVKQSKPKHVVNAKEQVESAGAIKSDGDGHDHGDKDDHKGHDHAEKDDHKDHDHGDKDDHKGHDHADKDDHKGHDHAEKDDHKDHDHAEKDNHKDHDHAEKDNHKGHDHGDHDGHDHGGYDPHYWTDPYILKLTAKAVGEEFAKADPTNASYYRDNAKKLEDELQALGDKFKSGLAQCERKTFVTAHAAFGYMAKRYGLEQIAISGIDPDSDPTPARLAQVEKLVKDKGVTTVFSERLLNPKVSEAIAKATGAKNAVLDPVESQADPNKDYLAVMEENLKALRAALGCK